MRTLAKTFSGLWKILLGAVFCQFLPTAILAVGWTYRAMQRRALRLWTRQSPVSHSELDTLAQDDPLFREHATCPNWLIRQRDLRGEPHQRGVRGRAAHFARNLGGSAWLNLRIGLAGISNTSLAMILPAVLWQIGWYAGWDNSFNKGYEQYYTGILLSWIGILLFLALMLYLPMAQARQAITGQWRYLYDLRTVWRISTGNPVRTLLLAVAFSLVALPINVMLIAVQGFGGNDEMSALTDSEFLQFLNRYYFWVSLLAFIGFVFVRMFAAKWYAAGLLSQLRSHRVRSSELSGVERHALRVLQLDTPEQVADRHPVIEATLSVSRPMWRTAVLSAAVLVWFTFVAQIYVREFLVYHPVRGFMNQPLVQLPWVRFIPSELQSSFRAAEKP